MAAAPAAPQRSQPLQGVNGVAEMVGQIGTRIEDLRRNVASIQQRVSLLKEQNQQLAEKKTDLTAQIEKARANNDELRKRLLVFYRDYQALGQAAVPLSESRKKLVDVSNSIDQLFNDDVFR